MSATKSRFSKPQNSRNITSKGGSGSGSKRGNNPATSGFTGKTSNIQVIYNGKIVTPLSLLPRKLASTSQHAKKYKPGASAKPREDTISELPEKSSLNIYSKSGIGSRKIVSTSELLIPERFNRKSLNANDNSSGGGKYEEKVSVILSETSTEILFTIHSLVISNETREVVEVNEKNAKYESLIDSHKNSDGFFSRPTQTLNNSQKNQNDMAAPNASQDFGCQALSYDITDAIAGARAVADVDGFSQLISSDGGSDDKTSGLTPYVRKFVRDTVGVSIATPGCLLNVNDLNRGTPTESNKNDGARAGGGGGRADNRGNKHHHSQSVQQSGLGASRSNNDEAHGSSILGGDGSGSRPSNSGMGVSNQHAAGTSSNYNQDNSEEDIQDRPPASSSDPGGDLASTSDSGTGASAPDGRQLLREREAKAVMTSKALLRKLQLAERAVLQNMYHRRHLDYRDLPDIQPLVLASKERTQVVDSADQLFGSLGIGGLAMGVVGSKLGKNSNSAQKPKRKSSQTAAEIADPAVDVEGAAGGDPAASATQTNSSSSNVPRLFCYRSESVVRGRPVTALAWNVANADLLAVGYGRIDFSLDGGQKPGRGVAIDEELYGGLVLFWSLRNPQHPEKVLRTPHPVTALDFSKRSPTLLALGLYSGDVSVYDVRREADWGKPVQTSSGMEGGHADPVWQVRWVAKGQERTETLVSISTDGSVLEWNLKKGLVVTTLMALKRGGVGEGWISRQAAGLCFDFVPGDSSTYVTGTEEGQIHRCSVSYSEQYLDSYEAHNGPVYRLRFSPRWPEVFLSCSADWTLNLYHIRSSSGRGPLLKMHCTGQEFAVTDMCWCPGNSTVFAAVTGDAKLQVWDLAVSAIDPIVNLDTNIDADADLALEQAGRANTEKMSARPGSPDGAMTPAVAAASSTGMRKNASGTRRDDHDREDGDKDRETPVAKLLKNLSQGGVRRSLTCVLFGERSPIVVVGDNRGAVSVYRVTNPVLLTHEGPLQQGQKLRDAVLRQSDPLEAAKLSSSSVANSETQSSGRGGNT